MFNFNEFIKSTISLRFSFDAYVVKAIQEIAATGTSFNLPRTSTTEPTANAATSAQQHSPAPLHATSKIRTRATRVGIFRTLAAVVPHALMHPGSVLMPLIFGGPLPPRSGSPLFWTRHGYAVSTFCLVLIAALTMTGVWVRAPHRRPKSDNEPKIANTCNRS
jgi:hypothetical protein